MMAGLFKLKPVLLGLLLGCSIHCHAADDLMGLYEKARQYDADYLTAVASTEADREEVNKARAQFFPKVQLSALKGRGETDRTTQTTFGPVESQLDYSIQNYSLNVRQPLYNKEILASYRGAQSLVSSKEALLRQENAKLMLHLAGTYLEILYAQEKVLLLQSKLNAVSQQLEQAQKRLTNGSGTRVEVNEAQTGVDTTKAEIILASNALADQHEVLFNMTGVQAGLEEAAAPAAKLDADKLPTAAANNENIDFWIKSAAENNPEIAAASDALETARQEIEKKRAGHYPTLDLVGVRSYSENDSNNTLGSRFDTTTVAVQLNVPIYAGGFVNASVRQAVSRQEAAEQAFNSKLRETTANVRRYFNGIRSQYQAIAAYRQAVQSSEIALTGTQKGFAAGFKTNIEVLDAQQKLYGNQLELNKARYGLLNDLVNLNYHAGLLNEGELAKISQLFISPPRQDRVTASPAQAFTPISNTSHAQKTSAQGINDESNIN